MKQKKLLIIILLLGFATQAYSMNVLKKLKGAHKLIKNSVRNYKYNCDKNSPYTFEVLEKIKNNTLTTNDLENITTTALKNRIMHRKIQENVPLYLQNDPNIEPKKLFNKCVIEYSNKKRLGYADYDKVLGINMARLKRNPAIFPLVMEHEITHLEQFKEYAAIKQRNPHFKQDFRLIPLFDAQKINKLAHGQMLHYPLPQVRKKSTEHEADYTGLWFAPFLNPTQIFKNRKKRPAEYISPKNISKLLENIQTNNETLDTVSYNLERLIDLDKNKLKTFKGLRYTIVDGHELNQPQKANKTSLYSMRCKAWLNNGHDHPGKPINHLNTVIDVGLNKKDLIPALKLATNLINHGDTIRLFVPAHLGYGAEGYKNEVPPCADLIIEATLETEIF